MKLSVGIIGLPNVGKSTLFNALTNQSVDVANYPFVTIDPNVGVVSVPDGRLDKLAKSYPSKEKIPAVVEFYDIAGLVKGANSGEGLGNQFLSHIREVSVIVHVVRAFESGEVVHVEGETDPVRDIEIVNTELSLKDIETVERRINKAEKDAKTGDKEKKKELEALLAVRAELDRSARLSSFDTEILELPVIKELGLLTSKPQIILINGNDRDITGETKEKIDNLGGEYLVADLNANVDLDELIERAYKVLGLITFFTIGDNEVRAWAVRGGALAPEAVGTIHSDFEKNFIRAEVIGLDKLLEAGGPSAVSSGQLNCWQEAKKQGFVRTEGKVYEVSDGDVIFVRHS